MALDGTQLTALSGTGGGVFHYRGVIADKAETEIVVEEAFSGGYEHHPFKYRPRVRYKFKSEEEEEAAEIIEDVVSRQTEILLSQEATKKEAIREAVQDIEIATRINLELRGIVFKKLYDKWIKREARELVEAHRAFEAKEKKKRRKNQEEELILLMLQ